MVKKAMVKPNGETAYPGWRLKKVTVSFNTSDSETWELYSDELNGTDGIPVAPTSLEYLTAGKRV